MSNTKSCGTCEHYDPILRGMKSTANGWCVKKSVYPHQDSPGQVTPPSAIRVSSPEEPAKPCIVQGAGIQAGCTLYMIRRNKSSKQDLLAQAMGKR